MSYTKTISIILLMYHIQYAELRCERRRTILRVQYSGCLPKRVMSYHCSGSCPSSVKPHPYIPLQYERQCQCCREVQSTRRRIRLLCSQRHMQPVQTFIFAVNIPMSCNCGNCQDTGYNSGNITTMTSNPETNT